MSTEEQTSIAGMFRRAQELRVQNPQASYKDIRSMLVTAFAGKPFPSADRLAIPEQDARAPEEDWTAGLPVSLRGIQQQDWDEIALGVIICLEQTENFERQRGRPGSVDEWHDRTAGIEKPTAQAIGKWLPAELLELAEKNSLK
jgi:hypothetical protein